MGSESHRKEELRRVPLHKVDASKWPKGVRVISLDEVDGLGVDIDGRLYWDGKPVEIIGQRIELTFGQKVYAFIIGAGALATFFVTILQGMTSIVEWMCKVHWVTSATFCAIG